MRDHGPSKGERPGIADADLLEELESSRRRVRELERNLAERELQEAADQKEVARLAEAFKPANIRAWCWTAEARLTQYLPIRGDVRDSQGRHASQVSHSEEGLLQAIHPDDRERVVSVWDRAYKDHVPYEIEYRLVLTGGEVRHNHEIGRPEFDESGRYLGHFGTTQDITDRMQAEEALREVRDELELRVEERTRDIEETNETLKREITERKRAEEALQIREQQFRDFAEASGDWFWETDAEHRFTWFSDRVEEITGVPVAFHIGKSRLELAADQAEQEKWHAHLEILEARRSFRNFGYLRKGHDGRLQHLTSSGVPVFDAEGNFKGYRGTGADITAAVEAEAKAASAQKQFMAAIESVSDGFALFDADDRMVFCNSRFKALNPHLVPKIVPGVSFEELLRDNIAANRILDALSDEEAFIHRRMDQHRNPSGPLVQQRRDGCWLELREEKTTEGATFLVNTDITERKRAEEAIQESKQALQDRIEQLEEAQRRLELQGVDLVRLAEELKIARDQAETANRTKSEFLAAMSHELRTPLNAIIGFSEVIKDERLGPGGSVKYRDYAQDIHSSGQHLLDLINDILDLSKVESGTDELHEENIKIADITRSAIGLVRQRAEKKGVELKLEFLENLPALCADKRKLKQILVNLLTNAIKFTEAGGKVTLRTWCDGKSGYVFQVIDTGIGIAPEDAPKALLQFGQVDSDLNRAYEGTGLGLPLTKALAEQHGGSLDLQSEVGVGTTVTVSFPAARIAQVPQDRHSLRIDDRHAS